MALLAEKDNNRWNRNRWLAVPVLLVLLTFIISLGYGFVSDDRAFLINNPNFLSQPIAEYFQHGVWYFSSLEVPNGQIYRPLGLLHLRIQAELWGSNPFGYHLTQILIHVTVTILVFFLLSLIIPAAPGKALALATSIFAIHSVQVESVCWIQGSDIWTAMLSFAAILLLWTAKDKIKVVPVLLSMVLIFAAMLTKETAYAFPAFMAILLLIHEESFGRKKIVLLTALSGIPLVIVFFLRKSAVQAPELFYSVAGVKKLFVYFLGYMKMTVFPLPQRFYLSEPLGGMVAYWEMLIGAIVLLGFMALVLCVKEGRRFLLCSAGWYVLTLAPAIAVAFHAVRATFAGRVLYLPLLSVSLILLWLMTQGPVTKRKCIERVVIVMIIFFTGASMLTRSSWEDQGSFLQMAIASTPDNTLLYIEKGDYDAEIGKIDEAIESYKFAVYRSNKNKDLILAHERLGEIYGKSNRLHKARREFEAILTIDPKSSAGNNGLGNVAWLSGDLLAAKKHYEKVLVNEPGDMIAQKNLIAVNRLLSKQ